MLIEDIGFAVIIIFAQVFGLFECHQAGYRTAIGKILVIPLTGALNENHRLGLFAVRGPHNFAGGGNLFKLMIGDHIGNRAITQMGKFALLRLVWPPSGCQNYRTKFFTIGIQGQNVLFALVEFHKGFMQFFGIQLVALFIELHFIGQGKRNVEFCFFTGLFEGHDKITRFSGDSRNLRLGFDGDVGIRFEFTEF